MAGHERNEERSIALHRAIAERARRDASVVERARERVRLWRENGSVAPFYVEAWENVLALDSESLSEVLVSPSEHARAIRQVTPFAGALTARERWAILRDFAP